MKVQINKKDRGRALLLQAPKGQTSMLVNLSGKKDLLLFSLWKV
jgi:hypothetical protein